MQLLIISHYSKTSGTTDHLIDYLDQVHRAYTYLRHPLPGSNQDESQIFLANPRHTGPEISYRKFQLFPFEIIRETFLSASTFLKQRKKFGTVICFGSINCVAVIPLSRLLHKKLVFWGVDYSRRRFNNQVLNSVYQWSETLSCKYADKVIQATPGQEDARVHFHQLARHKSIVIPNGLEVVTRIGFDRSSRPALVYSGSITQQHGIVNLVKLLSKLETQKRPRLYIFGAGEAEDDLRAVIIKYGLSKYVEFMGHRTSAEITQTLSTLPCRFFGVAPYPRAIKDHTQYGDSLKVKDYIAWGIPFIASDVVKIEPDLAKLGYVYSTSEDLLKLLANLENLEQSSFDSEYTSTVKKYEWGNLFKDFVESVA